MPGSYCQVCARTPAPGLPTLRPRPLPMRSPLGHTVCGDATLVSPLRRDGTVRPHADTADGAALAAATALSYTEASFLDTAPPVKKGWGALREAEQAHATLLGWEEELWENELEAALDEL